MKTFQEFVSEAYDASVMSSSQIRRTGEGERIGAERKKSTPERRRMKAVGGGKVEPVEYKPRKDIGAQRQTSTRVQQPEKERGSADVKAKAAEAAKAERKKAALARIAAKKTGGSATTEKPKAKEIAKTASKLLSKKAEPKAAAPGYKPAKASGYTRSERQKLMRAGEAELERRVRQSEAEKQGKKPSEVKLKNLKKSWS